MSKNVAVFVDVANIFYAAKAAGVDIDYVTLLKSASAGRDLVRAYAYTGLDPDNENQRNFHDFLRRHGYKVVSKDIRKYGDGKVKANLDIELVVDMMKTARNLDIAIVVSGDGDFAPAIRAVQEMGVRCEVISFRGNTSSDLIEVADLFTDITQLARVEKGSRSGRRVADDDADLSMTEVPDKQTEGTGAGRGRGRGRTGRREVEPIAMGGAARGGRGRGRSAQAPSNGSDPGVVALPGERLARVGSAGLTEADLAAAEVFTLDSLDADPGAPLAERPVRDDGAERDGETDGDGDGEGGRRRRRRGGRGRGRGRGRDGAPAEVAGVAELGPETAADIEAEQAEDEELEELQVAAPPIEAPRGPRTTPFGSVWDSQLGTPTAPSSASLGPIAADDEDFDEPEIPEYLIAERQRGATGGNRGGARGGGGGGNRGGARGGRAAYQSAMERERYGGGRGGGGINRYPDVSARTRQEPPREDRSYSRGRDERPQPAAPRPASSAEPWSEVPPELEAMLRAQVAQQAPAPTGSRDVTEAPTEEAAPTAAQEQPETAAPKRRTARKAAPAASTAPTTDTTDATSVAEAPAAPKKRATTRKPAASASAAPVEAAADGSTDAPAAPKKRATRKPSTASAADEAASTADGAAEPAAPKKRATRKATTAEPA
ncbi:MAG TPA: NYN domain-containing protein [Candidatus Saccharimonadales bacterium]|nr:NYN domain-containing protein [Candidatus Saccharimonadales bacterium]